MSLSLHLFSNKNSLNDFEGRSATLAIAQFIQQATYIC